MSIAKKSIDPRLQHLLKRYPQLEICEASIEQAFTSLCQSFTKGGQLLICGNGGSAADADHISGELLKGFQSKRPLDSKWNALLGPELTDGLQEGLPTLPLPNFTSLLTAFSNDCNPDHVYAQLTWVLGRKNDALLCITTSGNSTNIIHAAQTAKAKGLQIIALTGQTGGQIQEFADVCINAPSTITAEAQEYFLPIYHTLCLMLEDHFFGESDKYANRQTDPFA